MTGFQIGNYEKRSNSNQMLLPPFTIYNNPNLLSFLKVLFLLHPYFVQSNVIVLFLAHYFVQNKLQYNIYYVFTMIFYKGTELTLYLIPPIFLSLS
jgi:hypothetical protein